MSTYFVGDLQGCYRELEQLLNRVNFDASQDTLYLVGDIVARGPDSRKALELVIELGASAQTVLGNHDLNLLAVLLGVRAANPKDQLDGIISAPQSQRQLWIDWLRQQPLLLTAGDTEPNPFVLSHAGIYPWWTLAEAQQYADEIHAELQSDRALPLLEQMYGNKPTHWHSSLQGFDRYRFIVNAFTRMRYCAADGMLELTAKGDPNKDTNEVVKPWFNWWKPQATTVIFGHWAALQGQTGRTDVIGLDTGCVWGKHLTLMSWPQQQLYQQSALQNEV